MPSDLREHEIREFLQSMAREMPTPANAPAAAMHRARAKLARSAISLVVVAALVVTGAVAGARSILRAETSQPAGEDQVAPIVAIPIEAGVPRFVAVGEGGVWVAGQGVFRIDPATNGFLASFPSGPGRGGSKLALGEGSVWVSGGAYDGEILRIDPGTNEIAATIHTAGYADPYALAAGGGAVWATTHTDATLLRIDPATDAVQPVGELPETVMAGPRPAVHGVAVLDGTVWIVGSGWDDGNGELFGLSVDAEGPWDRVPVMVDEQVWAGFGSLWGLSSRDGTLLRIDPSSGSVLARIDIGFAENPGRRVRLAIGEGALWVSDGSGSLHRIDPATNQVVASLRFEAPVEGLAVGAGAIWVADGIETVFRIDPGAFEPGVLG